MFTFGYSNRLNGPMRALVAVVVGIIMIIYNEQAMNIVVKIIAALLFASISLHKRLSLKHHFYPSG